MENFPLFLILSSIVKIVIIVHLLLIGVMIMIWAERRVSGWMQDRLGPNRVGPQGLLQPVADGLKFMFKEDIIPDHVDKPLYVLAPAMLLIPALVTVAVVPFGSSIELFGETINLQIADVNIGILYILAITSLGVYGVVLGAWASNNKYSLLGGLRSSAQMISYELTLGLGIIGILMLTSSLSLRAIAQEQGAYPWHWNFLIHFPAFLAFTTAMFAETNRLPFDLAEAEQELVAGYHTEYSSMKFAMFFMAEYMNMIVGSAVTVTLFLGGWHFFGLENVGGSCVEWPYFVRDLLRQDSDFPVRVYLGPLDPSAVPLRPTHELWLEILVACRLDFNRCNRSPVDNDRFSFGSWYR